MKDTIAKLCPIRDIINTPISFTKDGKCVNGNLITILYNNTVKNSYVLHNGKKITVASLGGFKDGYCTCCDETTIITSGSSGGSGINGGLNEFITDYFSSHFFIGCREVIISNVFVNYRESDGFTSINYRKSGLLLPGQSLVIEVIDEFNNIIHTTTANSYCTTNCSWAFFDISLIPSRIFEIRFQFQDVCTGSQTFRVI